MSVLYKALTKDNQYIYTDKLVNGDFMCKLYLKYPVYFNKVDNTLVTPQGLTLDSNPDKSTMVL